MPKSVKQFIAHATLAPQLAQYQCTGRDRVFVAPDAFPFILIPSVVVVRLGRRK